MNLPDIPKSWLVLFLLICMVILRALSYDTFVTAALSGIAFYILGKHNEQTTEYKYLNENEPPSAG